MVRVLLKRVKVNNFKSFDEIDVELGNFNVIIGANASGKSNFINIFKFLKNITEVSLDDAISMQGGVDYVRNVIIGPSKDLSIEVQMHSQKEPIELPILIHGSENKRQFFSLELNKMKYKFSIGFYKRKKGYKVKEEILEASVQLKRLVKKDGELIKDKKKVKAKIILIRDETGRIKSSLKPKDLPVKAEDLLPRTEIFPEIFLKRKASKELFFLKLFYASPVCFFIRAFFESVVIYDIDPKLSKKSTLITGKTDLETDGSNLAIVLKNILETRKGRKKISNLIKELLPFRSNLAIVLKNILETRKGRKKISNLIKELLPFIEDISVEKLADKSLITCLREEYCGKRFLPAPLISDGTINLTAMIVALYFTEKPLIIIEEPGRNIHPYLISKVIDMMKEVSERFDKQIIVTTHNPEVVKYAGIENILLVYRDDNFSRISKPGEKKEVKHFLKNKMGVEELYVQNLLKW